MTKKELEYKIQQQRKKLNELLAEYEKMNQVFDIDNKEKPFKKWSLAEQEQLFELKESAYSWLLDNKDKSILDYNNEHTKEQRITFAK